MQPKVHQGLLNAQGFRFAVIASRWIFLTEKLVSALWPSNDSRGLKFIEIFKVPGSFECSDGAEGPKRNFERSLHRSRDTRRTPHSITFRAKRQGTAQAMMQTGIPVLFGVVTADTLEQAINRAGVKSGNKGFESAMSAVEIVNLYKAMESGEKPEKEKFFPHVV